MTRGHNAGRQLTGGSGQTNITQQYRDHLQGGAPPTLQRAVVVDVIYDPTSLTNDQISLLEDTVVNPEMVEGMPYNSILGRVITNGQDLGHPSLHVFYPMFPTHFQLPIKPGEQVLIMYEDYSGTGNAVGYWVSRPMAARQIEDVNYTHGDRIFDPYNHPRNMTSNILSNLTASAPTFPNGAGTPESLSLQPSGSMNPYDDIVTQASASAIVTFEPVPRLKKRPGDFLIQGSNNAAILLGQDRTGPALRVTGSDGKDIIEKAGTIDLVAGLGAPRKLPADETTDPSVDNHNPTSPRVIQNARQKKEVYKTPYKSQKVDNPKEGDPDFLRDLSRLYIAMKTKGDLNFKINFGGDGGIFPSSGDKLMAEIADLPSDEQNGQPFIVLKSEQIRIIGKGKDEDNGPAAHGEIRFIKEGKVDDKDLSLFVMTKEGRIVMVGKDIQMQTHADGKVLLRCKTATTDDADPIVLFTKFKECITEIHDKIKELRDTVSTEVGNLGSQGIPAPNAAGPFSPIPGLIKLKVQTSTAKSNIKNFDPGSIKDKIDPCKSKWVFVNKENQS
jgi:hypothetical protein